MTEPTIREYANTWEVRNEADAQHEICRGCEIEEHIAQTSVPTLESEGYGEPEEGQDS